MQIVARASRLSRLFFRLADAFSSEIESVELPKEPEPMVSAADGSRLQRHCGVVFGGESCPVCGLRFGPRDEPDEVEVFEREVSRFRQEFREMVKELREAIARSKEKE